MIRDLIIVGAALAVALFSAIVGAAFAIYYIGKGMWR